MHGSIRGTHGRQVCAQLGVDEGECRGAAFALHSMPAVVVAVIVVVVALVLLSLVQASLQGIYAAALYRYAEAGEGGAGFEPALLQGAFRPKK
ncbi:DUF6159 family protein [Frateuria soli]|uniref:DUF6159 family protein n=1 Tax=Frateuria soli TaxID=1542730 RepID=UPI0030841E13